MMFDLVVLIVFVWLFVGAVRLAFRVTWGLAKIVATILFILALPALIVTLLAAGGAALLIPLGLLVLAWGVLKACI
jgi:hypothetical protein